MVNLGDPIVHVDPNGKSGTFDQTLGTKLTEGSEDQMESYQKIDFNGNGTRDSVVTFYQNGKIGLLANYNGTFKDMGYLADVPEAGQNRKGV